MNEVSGQQQAAEELNPPFEQYSSPSAEEVKAYLLANPDFFNQHPELLERIEVPHAHRGSVSLVERQSDQLRDKVRSLSHKLNQLISIAKQNEEIYRVYADLNLKLLECKFVSQLQDTLESVIRQRLKLSAVTLRPFSGAHALPEIQRKLFLEKRFKQDSFFFGRISQHERQLLFTEQPAESVALMLLGERSELGILAIGSTDPGHFNPDMDTLLITQLQKFLNILLPNLEGY